MQFQIKILFFWFYMYNNKFGMVETPGFSVTFPVCIRETGRNPQSVD